MQVITLLTLLLSTTLIFGVDTTLKIMFFGDSLISGVHNSDVEVCPFRYEFLRLGMQGREVQVVGTNKDKKGTCQKIGEELSVQNNGYQQASTDDLLDYITADLQFLHNPVDYIFSSIGLQDCLSWEVGGDFQIVSQSVRRIMGRLLNLNENAKIYHLPIMLPPSAGKVALDCMTFVNKKLADIYDSKKQGNRILILDPLEGAQPIEDLFIKIARMEDKEPVVTPVVTKPAIVPQAQPSAVQKPVITTPTAPVTTPAQPSENVENSNANRRRLKNVWDFLPNKELSIFIAKLLVISIDWDFRAQTPTPTMEVTKEPDYYGYDWCKENYEDKECFEYYYGYLWCLKEYSEDECYAYYYGDVESWEKDDNYKWCLNFYDEEYCSFAYLGEEPETWDWLSFGYHDCTKVKDIHECFEQYYGYAWCVNEYNDKDCYEYYYGEGFEWDAEKSIKWCLNFYDESECLVRYDSSATFNDNAVSSKWVAFTFAITAGVLVWVSYRKYNCFKSKEYSRLNTPTTGGEDEVELL